MNQQHCLPGSTATGSEDWERSQDWNPSPPVWDAGPAKGTRTTLPNARCTRHLKPAVCVMCELQLSKGMKEGGQEGRQQTGAGSGWLSLCSLPTACGAPTRLLALDSLGVLPSGRGTHRPVKCCKGKRQGPMRGRAPWAGGTLTQRRADEQAGPGLCRHRAELVEVEP